MPYSGVFIIQNAHDDDENLNIKTMINFFVHK